MFEKDDKRSLYWLMEMYLSDEIDASTFCDEFYYSYDLEIDHYKLSEVEQRCFAELSIIAGRFSEFESDHKNYPGVFFTEAQLKQKILETKEKLQSEYPVGLISAMKFTNKVRLNDLAIVRALWYDRSATLKDCTEQLLEFLVKLKAHNSDLFGIWYDQSLQNEVELSYQSIKQLLGKWTQNDNSYPETSYKASCWNGASAEEAASFSVKLGTGGQRSYPNSCDLNLPFYGPQYDYYKDPVHQETLTKLIRKHWNPDLLMIKAWEGDFIEI